MNPRPMLTNYMPLGVGTLICQILAFLLCKTKTIPTTPDLGARDRRGKQIIYVKGPGIK